MSQNQYLVPTWEMAVKEKGEFKTDLINRAQRRWMEQYARDPKTALVRGLNLYDLGISSWRTPPQQKGDVSTWIETTIKEWSLLTIYKVVLPEKKPKVREIIFECGGKQYTYGLSQLYGLVPMLDKVSSWRDIQMLDIKYGLKNLRCEGWIKNPGLLLEDQSLKISVSSEEDNKEGDMLVLVGFVIRPETKEVPDVTTGNHICGQRPGFRPDEVDFKITESAD